MAEERLYQMTLLQARKLEDAGKLLEAYEIVNNLAESFGENDELRRLRQNLRGALHRQLARRFGDRSIRLQQLVTTPELRKRRSLRARDALLFEKLDGATTIDDLLALSPLDEVDTFVALARLIDLQLVAPPHN